MIKSNPTQVERKEYRKQAIASHVSRGWIYGENKAAGVIVLHKSEGDCHLCKIIVGGSIKFEKNFYRFRTFERMAECVARNVENLIKRNKDKADRAAAAKETAKKSDARDHWTAGDVVYNSWGYDQTNVDFYQVTRVSKASVWIRPISRNSNDHGQPGGGKCQPRRCEFTGEEIRKKFHASHPGYISFDHGCGSKWDGRALYTSSDR